jgi:hypothetical protein
MQPDKIEQAVLHGFDILSEIWSRIEISQGKCTRQIKNQIGAIGAIMGFEVYASKCVFEENSEWLYDLCWVEETRAERVVGLPLAMESEWNPYALSEDFQKLMVSKAEHRVMVISAKTKEAFKRSVESLIDEVKSYKESQYNDRYLFLGWIEKDEFFKSKLYVHESA